MKISLVICSRDRAERLARMVWTLDGESLKRNGVEVNLIDSASVDNTLDIMLNFKSISGLAVNVQHVDAPGLGRARRVGVEISSGDVIVFTDDDCVVDGRYFDILADVWDEDKFQYGGGQILMFDPEADPRVASRQIREREEIPPGTIIRMGFLQGANMFFARSVFARAGSFNAHVGAGTPFPCEDIEMATRASLNGFRGVLLPELKVLHDHRRKRGSPEAERTVEGYDFGRGAYYASLIAAGHSGVWQLWERTPSKERSTAPAIAKLAREMEGASRYLAEVVLRADAAG